MLYEKLDLKEKMLWLKYTIIMEDIIANRLNNIDYDSVKIEESKRRLLLIAEINEFNKEIYTKMRMDIFKNVNKEDLIDFFNLNVPDDKMYPFNFNYLIRDWSVNKDYNQRELIVEYINRKLVDFNILKEDKALFIGCGNGRYALDLGEAYSQVDAFDNSFPMIWSIYHLMQVDSWEVLYKTERNCRKVEDTLLRKSLSMNSKQKTLIEEKVSFFVNDVKSVKIDTGSINHIYSIYFTDVLPLKLLFEKVDSWLKIEGLFIHFGPLDYFFTKEEEMMTCEEVKAFFSYHGYRILADEFFSSRHLYNENSMKFQTYDNWFFMAKKEDKKRQIIFSKMILFLNENVVLTETNSPQNGKNHKKEFSVHLNSISFILPQIISELLMLCDSVKSLELIIEELDIEIREDDKNGINEILQELLDKNFILSHN